MRLVPALLGLGELLEEALVGHHRVDLLGLAELELGQAGPGHFHVVVLGVLLDEGAIREQRVGLRSSLKGAVTARSQTQEHRQKSSHAVGLARTGF